MESFIESLADNNITAKSEKYASILKKKCKEIVKLKKLAIKATAKFKEIYDKEKNDEIKKACITMLGIANEIFNNGSNKENSKNSLLKSITIDNKTHTISSGKNKSKNKKLCASIDKVKKIYDFLKDIDVKGVILASSILEKFNPKLKTGKNDLVAYYSDLKNCYSTTLTTFDGNLASLSELSNDVGKVLRDKEEYFQRAEQMQGELKLLVDEIYTDYDELRGTAKVLNGNFKKFEKNALKLQAANLDATKDINQKNFENQKYIENFLPEIKKIKKEAKAIMNSEIVQFDIRSLQSAKAFPSKVCNKILKSISVFLKNGDSKKIEESLEIGASIKSIKDKIDAIEGKKYENGFSSDSIIDIEQTKKEAEKWFKSRKQAPPDVGINNLKNTSNEKIKAEVEKEFGKFEKVSDTLESIKTEVEKSENKNKKAYHLALIECFSNNLKEAFFELKEEFDKIFKPVQELMDHVKKHAKLKKVGHEIASKIDALSSVTGPIATIGCFAGFAISFVCPIVGWLIAGICVVAFVVNLSNGIIKLGRRIKEKIKKRKSAT